MNTCERCGKSVGASDWDIHTCTPIKTYHGGKPWPLAEPPAQCWKCGDMDASGHAKCTVPACGMKEQAMSKDIIEMARDAGLFTHKEVQPELKAFAELVRADEREACAKVCETTAASQINGYECADAIRARGQA